jgi:hypothetical protein
MIYPIFLTLQTVISTLLVTPKSWPFGMALFGFTLRACAVSKALRGRQVRRESKARRESRVLLVHKG